MKKRKGIKKGINIGLIGILLLAGIFCRRKKCGTRGGLAPRGREDHDAVGQGCRTGRSSS